MKWNKCEIDYLKDNATSKTFGELVRDLDRSKGSINYKLVDLGLHSRDFVPVKDVNENFFDIWTEEMSYILGYWFADGNIKNGNDNRYTFRIDSNDKSIIDKIQTCMKSNHKIYHRKSTGGYCLGIGNKKIYNDIIKLGGLPKKSLINKFPYVPKEYVRHFIRGYFDGDGCITHSGKKKNVPVIIFIGTKEFLNKLMEYTPYRVKKITQRTKNNTYEIRFRSEMAQSILEYMYDKSSIYLDRKYNLYKKCMKWERKSKPYPDYSKYIENEI